MAFVAKSVDLLWAEKAVGGVQFVAACKQSEQLEQAFVGRNAGKDNGQKCGKR